MILETIHTPADLRALSEQELTLLSGEIREAILDKVSHVGGHLGSNLGIVELTVALHRTFESPADKIIFDVSHQTYAHKILTGRKDAFVEPEHFGDVSGFMSPAESDHDPFTIGHTSTSVSLATGMALARSRAGDTYHVVAVIGDGALSGGEALEGLNYAATLNVPLVIVVNDNNSSIAENVGALYHNLAELRSSHGEAEHNFFKLLGLDYLFVEDGHNVSALCSALEEARVKQRPCVVHVVTQKGHGFAPAEQNTELFHSVKPFDRANAPHLDFATDAYADLFSDLALDAIARDANTYVVSSATPLPLGFTPQKRELAGEQFIDCGIAEQTAVALSAGIAKTGARAIYGVQSTFLQRAYDQVAQELALDALPATLVVFCGSIYATHDKTHQGRLDIPMLTNIPNFVYVAPATREQFESAFAYGLSQREHPFGIKVPGIWAEDGTPFAWDWSKTNTSKLTQTGSQVTFLGLGTFYGLACECAQAFEEQTLCKPSVVNPLFASGIDTDLLDKLMENTRVFVTIEDGIVEGGWGQKVAAHVARTGHKCLTFGLPKTYQDRYVVEDELKRSGLTADHIVAKTMQAWGQTLEC